jgi:hypothetical protein
LPEAVGRPPANVFSSNSSPSISFTFIKNPVRKGTAAGAGNLIPQQLDCAVEDSVVMGLHKALFAVIEEPDHTPVLDGFPEQWIRLEHP